MQLRDLYRKASRYEKTTLPNRLTVVTQRTDSPDIGLVYGIRYGSAHELPELRGAAHFAEHMFFETGNKEESARIQRRMEWLTGESSNAFTMAEYILFSPSTARGYRTYPEYLSEFLNIIYDAVTNQNIEIEEFEREKEAIINEIKGSEGTQLLDFRREVGRRLWSNHPYGEPVVGTVDIIRRVTPEMLADTRRYLLARNGYIFVGGDIPYDVSDMISRIFSPMEVGYEAPEISEVPQLQQGLEPIWKKFENVDIQTIGIYYITVPSTDPDSLKLSVLFLYLCNGLNSVLYKRLRDSEKLCYGVAGGHYVLSRGSTLNIEIRNVNEENKEKAIQSTDEEIERIRQGEIDTDLLGLVKNTTTRGFYHTFLERMPSRAITFATREMDHRIPIEEELDIIIGTTPQDLQALAQKYLTDRRVIYGEFRT